MATYKMIGADQKEYGPVSAEQLRQWINEGRLNAQTQVLPEGATEWKALGEVLEFADAFKVSVQPTLAPGSPPARAAGSGTREAALQAVKGPAIALIVNAILNLLLSIWGLIRLIFLHPNVDVFSSMPQFNDPQTQQSLQQMMQLIYGPIGIVSNVIGLSLSVLVLVGALRMQELRNYSFVFVASILAMVPCVTPCCVLGLPFGIWALVVLNRLEVKSQFS